MATLKYQQVKKYIIDFMQAEHLKYGDPIPTESELMKRFDVSRHTVRRALSDLVNEGWLYTMQGSGTYVSDPNADMNISGKMVGIITTYFRDYIFPDIISGMDDVFSEEGYSLLLGTTKNNSTRERVVLNNMLNNQLAGLIVEPSKSVYPNQNIQLYRKFINRGIPVLFIHATYRALETSYVIQDDEYAGYIVTKHLIDLGHKYILGIFKQDDMQGHGRYQGYQNALEEAGINTGDDLVQWFTTEGSRKVASEENIKAWLDENEKVTAFVCYNDKLAVNVLNSLMALGYSVPQDYSIVSFDNSKRANTMVTKLTSVAHPKAELGEKAAHLLIELMKNPNQIFEEVMKPELVIGDSTRKI
ncbi:GntR family transcriptional regulator [Fusibacter ferrireducens]|uniref:GntR family transcriptional regulator n=1 Tax=Fusibacter ferrireducens TaxID=2785058 RepID=A0ABR9ZZJ4_9FIRM|nr:GntR family transcriptional regulator [Fusibacter ferrireducens]MBF4695044.1 GntR family transcriptional regulator [Fusibacter ferrireducens]